MNYGPPCNDIHNNEELDGLHWSMNKNIDHPEELGIHPLSHIKEEYQKKILKTEIWLLLAFLPLKFWLFHLNECNKYILELTKEKYY